MKLIALSKIEYRLYGMVDVAGMYGRGINIREELGDDYSVTLRITPFHDGILANHIVVDTTKVSFSVHIGKGEETILQIDNEVHGYLHLHDKKYYSKKVPLPETMRVGQLIDLAFSHARETLKNDLGYEIIDSKRFVGSAEVKKVNERGIVTDVEVYEADLKKFETDD